MFEDMETHGRIAKPHANYVTCCILDNKCVAWKIVVPCSWLFFCICSHLRTSDKFWSGTLDGQYLSGWINVESLTS